MRPQPAHISRDTTLDNSRCAPPAENKGPQTRASIRADLTNLTPYQLSRAEHAPAHLAELDRRRARPRRTTSSPSSRNARRRGRARSAILPSRARRPRSSPSPSGRRCGASRRSRSRARAAAASSSRACARSRARRPRRSARSRASRSSAQSRPPARCGSGGGSCGGASTRHGSSSESGVTQAEIDVRNDLPRNGPSGGVLPRLDVARAPVVDEHDAEDVVGERLDGGTGSPSQVGTPTTKPSSSSTSSRRVGANTGSAAPGPSAGRAAGRRRCR